MQKNVLWFVLGASLSVAANVAAASGDLVLVSRNVDVSLTGAQAAGLADAFIALGAWSGDRADMRGCNVWREAPGDFRAKCDGVLTASPSQVASRVTAGESVEVVGVVE